jgi:hypothetical protein
MHEKLLFGAKQQSLTHYSFTNDYHLWAMDCSLMAIGLLESVILTTNPK